MMHPKTGHLVNQCSWADSLKAKSPNMILGCHVLWVVFRVQPLRVQEPYHESGQPMFISQKLFICPFYSFLHAYESSSPKNSSWLLSNLGRLVRPGRPFWPPSRRESDSVRKRSEEEDGQSSSLESLFGAEDWGLAFYLGVAQN